LIYGHQNSTSLNP